MQHVKWDMCKVPELPIPCEVSWAKVLMEQGIDRVCYTCKRASNRI